jgi:hypothetical protein
MQRNWLQQEHLGQQQQQQQQREQQHDAAVCLMPCWSEAETSESRHNQICQCLCVYRPVAGGCLAPVGISLTMSSTFEE